MFESARLKLTAWYLLILIIISGLFSVAFYNVATREVEDVINHIKRRQQFEMGDSQLPPPVLITLEALNASKERLQNELLVVNGIIILIAGTASYFLAGRTLKPIKLMLDEQNEFISNASHELRTPIATLRAEMEANLLEKNITDKNARDLINSNLEELGELQDLTNNLLRVAQITDLNLENSIKKISLMEIVQIAMKKVSPLAKKKHIQMNTQLKEIIVKGDKGSLTELFVILLDNAIKYTAEKSEIDVLMSVKNGRSTVAIKDKGMGISADDLPHIFERFYRSDKSRSGTDGYGLGLSIAKKIVEAHHGHIGVQSTTAKNGNSESGTTFSVFLPTSSSAAS